MKLPLLLIICLALSSCSIGTYDGLTAEQWSERYNSTVEEFMQYRKDMDVEIKKQNFENDLKCQERADQLKKQFGNVHSGSYDEYSNSCYVSYYEEGKLIYSPMNGFGPAQNDYAVAE